MRRRTPLLASLLLIVAAFLVLDRAAAWLLGRALPHSEMRYALLYSGRLDADVYIIGNSRARSSFDAPWLSKQSGHRIVNLSYDGLGLGVTRALLDDALDRNPTPKVVVIEATVHRGDESVLKDLRLFAAQSPRLKLALREHYPRLHFAGQLTHLFRFNADLYWRALALLDQSDQHWMADGRLDARDAQGERAAEKTAILFRPPTAEQAAALASLCRDLAARGVTARLIVAPAYLPSAVARSTARAMVEALQQYLPAGLVVEDFSAALVEPHLFSDLIHANRSGALAFSDLLLRRGLLESVENNAQVPE